MRGTTLEVHVAPTTAALDIAPPQVTVELGGGVQIELGAIQGPRGLPGSSAYTHTQTNPSQVWTVQHNLGYRPAGDQTYDTDDGEVEGLIAHVTDNVLTISFTVPRRGVAYFS